MKEFDTIAAISTPIGEGGISIIRISGAKSLSIASNVFRGFNGRDLSDIKPYTMRFGYIICDGEDIDEVIISFMKGPRSFTGEDTIEINCHGGVIVIKKILEVILKNGARSAEPGEFTKRAFLNGRIDLSQAEAVMDIINSKTEASMKSAVAQSKGRLSKEIKKIRDSLINVIAHIEATIDYPEDDMEEMTAEDTKEKLRDIIKIIDYLISTAEEGKLLREGLSLVIVGKPNVGKSSLLNALTYEDKAIVTDVPGTTRDVIEEYINMDGIPIKIIDTAGIRKTDDVVEKIGIERSKDKIKEADLVIMMLDISKTLEVEDLEIINYIKDKKYLVLLNKADLTREIDIDECNELNKDNVIYISLKALEGLTDLKEKIKKMFFNGEIKAGDVIISNSRHKEVLFRAKEDIISAINALDNTFAIDLASIDIRNAWNVLGEITGEVIAEDLIDKIFRDFCLGK